MNNEAKGHKATRINSIEALSLLSCPVKQILLHLGEPQLEQRKPSYSSAISR